MFYFSKMFVPVLSSVIANENLTAEQFVQKLEMFKMADWGS